MDGGGTCGGDNTDVCNGDGDGDKKGNGAYNTMALFSLKAQAGGQVVELGGVPDGPAALNIVPDGHLAGPAALVAWASCLEHRDQHLQKLRGH